MNFEKLLSEGKIEKIEKEEIDFDLVEKDLEVAKKNLENGDYGWTETIAYNSILRAGIKLMGFLGFRAIGKEHHKNVFEFLNKTGIEENLIRYFNKMRVKRNEFIYKDISSSSLKECKETIKLAEELVQEIRTFVQEIRTENKEVEATTK